MHGLVHECFLHVNQEIGKNVLKLRDLLDLQFNERNLFFNLVDGRDCFVSYELKPFVFCL